MQEELQGLWLFLFHPIIALRIRGTNARFITRSLGARGAVAAALDEVSPAVSAMAHLHQASGRAEHLHARPSVQTRLGALAIGERAAGDGGRRQLLLFASAQMLAFHVTCRSNDPAETIDKSTEMDKSHLERTNLYRF
jgi:hypothetical protein